MLRGWVRHHVFFCVLDVSRDSKSLTQFSISMYDHDSLNYVVIGKQAANFSSLQKPFLNLGINSLWRSQFMT